MNRILGIVPLMCVMLVVLTGCSSSPDDNRSIQLKTTSSAVETINGEAVPKTLLEAMARGRGVDLADAEKRKQVLDELTQYVILAQEAQRQRFYGNEQFDADVEIARLQGVANATVARLQELSPISDEMLKQEYDQQVAKAGKFTYDFSQILFDKEEDAITAAGEVVAGKLFSEIHERWKNKGKQAKTFRQARLSQIPDSALAKSLEELKPGETTKVPVKTKYGWHIVHLEAINPYIAPPFEQIKETMRKTMQSQILDQRIEELRKKARIVGQTKDD